MGKRRRRSLVDQVLEAVSRFPWWVSVLLAIVVFIFLHRIAGIEVERALSLDQFGQSVGSQLIKAVASLGQWIFPALLLVGAAFSGWKQYRRSALHARVGDTSRAALLEMSWQEFESLVGEYFRRRGFAVRESTRGPDGGIDLILEKGMDRYLVQCKQWRAMRVGVETVRELYGVIAAQCAAGGFVVTSGQFTAEAKKFSQGLEIELIDGDQLGLLIHVQHRLSSEASQSEPITLHAAPPLCPVCASPMVERVARKGPLAGRPFWGCARYPACSGIRSHQPVS